MKNKLRSFRNKALISFLIFTLLLQSASPVMGVSAKSAVLPQQNIADGLTIGEDENIRPVTESAPDYGQQVAALAKAQPTAKPTVHLKASVSPAIYIPGKPIHIMWTTTGVVGADAGKAQVSIKAPLGLTPTDATMKSAMSASGVLNMPVSNGADGKPIDWVVSASAKFPLEVLLSLTVNGKETDQTKVLIDQGKFDMPSNGGVINSRSKDISVTIPNGAITEALAFDIRNPSPQRRPPTSLSGTPVEIIAVGKTSGQDVTKFKLPIRIQVPYNPNKDYGASQESLSLYYYDSERSDWYPLSTTVDTVKHTLIAESDHLTVFDYKAEHWQSNDLPTVDSFKVSDFTGAGTYGVSLWTPPGPNGMKPNLSLNYNSQVIDESSAFTQASWVGMGWSLETGSITRNMHGTDTIAEDDTFSISVNGISGTLLQTPAGYKTAEDSFAKIEYDDRVDSNGYIDSTWKVWGKDGTVYSFAAQADMNKDDPKPEKDGSDPCVTDAEMDNMRLSAKGAMTWKWNLTSAKDTHGNEMLYENTIELKGGSCNNNVAMYPKTITYPNNKYRVSFEPEEEDRHDLKNVWTQNASRAMFSRKRLDKILIQHNVSGAWTTIREYDLTYAPNGQSVYPSLTWDDTGAPTSTLAAVQEKNGAAIRPPVLFAYDQEHLTGVNNGQGGVVAIGYSPWSYSDEMNDDLRSFRTNFTNGTEDECKPGEGTSWTGQASCSAGRLDVYGTAYHAIPENISKPLARYRYVVELDKNTPGVNGKQLVLGFRDTTGNKTHTAPVTVIKNTNDKYIAEVAIDMQGDFNPATTDLLLDCNDCLIKHVEFQLEPGYARVSHRTVYDGISASNNAMVSYDYDNPAPNTVQNSLAIQQAGQPEKWTEVLYTPPLREFRGHAMSMVTNPPDASNAQLSTFTWFHQSDSLKGRAYETFTAEKKTNGTFDGYESFDGTEPEIAANWTVGNWPGVEGNHLGAEYDSQAYTTSNGPAVSLMRNTASLSSGQMAMASFKLSDNLPQEAQIGLTSTNNVFYGLVVKPSGNNLIAVWRNGTQEGALLNSPYIQLNKWYTVMLFLDNSNGFRIRFWQQDNPTVSGEIRNIGIGVDTWKFGQKLTAFSGRISTLALDSYFEGVPYTESTTTYTTEVEYDTDQANTIPNISGTTLLSYRDLAVNWSYVTETTQRTYNGDAAWVGTRSTYAYREEDQGGQQFGNLTRQTDYTWTGSDWAAYRGSKTYYYPNPSSYLVSLPAREVQVDCAIDDACNYAHVDDDSDLLTETLYLYDSANAYDQAPGAKGELRAKRVLVSNLSFPVSNMTIGYGYMQTSMAYDSYGNLTDQRVYPDYVNSGGAVNTASPNQLTHTEYDTAGYNTYPVEVTNALGQTTKTAYNYLKGLPETITDPNLATTTATYDEFGHILTITAAPDISPTLQIAYHNYVDASHPYQVDLKQRVDGSAWIRLSRFYNGLGKEIQMQNVGAVVDVNNVATQKTTVTDTQYDKLGNVIKVTMPYAIPYNNTPDFNAQIFGQPLNRPYTAKTYDALGRLKTVRQPNGNTTTTDYTDPAPSTGQTSRVKTIDPVGSGNPAVAATHTTTSVIDVWGRTLSVAPALGPGLSYTYDVLGQLLEAKKGVGSSATTTTLIYDTAGRKNSIADPDMGTWRYVYDAAGNLTQQYDARNCATTLDYDALNRPLSKTYSINCNQAQVTYGYDSDNDYADQDFQVGRRTSMTTDAGNTGSADYNKTTWKYDPRGRVLREIKTINGQQFGGTSWTYNSADLPVTMTYPDSETVTYAYNAAGGLKQLTSNITTPATTYAKDMLYDEAARMTSMIVGNGVINREFTYAPWTQQWYGGLMTSLSATQGETTLQSLTYKYRDYDRSGNVYQIINNASSPVETSTFAYDKINRIIAASASTSNGVSYSEAFNYNPNTGNLWHKGANSATWDEYLYPSIPVGETAALHPHAVLAVGSTSTQQYQYDLNGNMISRIEPDGVTRFLHYDAENRLVSVNTAVPPTATATRTRTKTSTVTLTKTKTLTNTKTLTSTVTLTKTKTFTRTVTLTETPTLTETITLTPTPAPTDTPTLTETVTPTEAVTATETMTATTTVTPTPTATATPLGMVSAGMYNTCRVKSDGSLACWGDNYYGQSNAPSGTFTQVSAGERHSCAIKTDGSVICWGSNSNGQINAPSSGTFTQVGVGAAHSCGLKTDGTIVCWGPWSLLTGTPTTNDFSQLSVGIGGRVNCALKTNGTVQCWGDNTYYGNATPPSDTFTQISVGVSVACGIKTDNTLACWGYNAANGLLMPPSGTFTQVSLGWKHACAIKTDGSVVCWGSGTTTNYIQDEESAWEYGQAIPPSGTFTKISAGGTHSCGFRNDGILVCWGGNNAGELNYIVISGNAGVAGASLQYTDGSPKSVIADASGNYAFVVAYNWTGTVTPVLAGYNFWPISRGYANSESDQIAQDYWISSTPTVTATSMDTDTPEPTDSFDPTETVTPTVTATPTLTPTLTVTQTLTITQTQTITKTPTATSEMDSYTKALLHFDGTDGSTTFTDVAGKSWSATGNAQIDTAIKKYGTGSLLLDGTSDDITSADSDDFYLGTGDFTLDTWVRFTSLPASGVGAVLYSQVIDSNNSVRWLLSNTNGTYYWLFRVSNAGTLTINVQQATTIATNTWYHIAVVRSGDDFMIFEDGTQLGTTTTDSDDVPNLSASVRLGTYNGSNPLAGQLDDFRISKGIARWTSNFTFGPTSTPTPNISRTPTLTPTRTPSQTRTTTQTRTPTATTLFQPTPTLAPFTGASYLYDPDGNMIKSTVNGVVSYFPSKLYNKVNNVIHKYYVAGSQTVAMRVGSTLNYLLSDHLGSTSLTTNASGAPIAEMRYTAFGETRYSNGTTPTDHRYTGQREQRDLGLYFYNARWYDPALGRFTQADNIPTKPGDYQSMDRFAYALNNPILYNDPSGHFIIPFMVVAAILFIAVPAANRLTLDLNQVQTAAQDPVALAKEQLPARQWQYHNSCARCHYSSSDPAGSASLVNGSSPETPLGDAIVDGSYNVANDLLAMGGAAAGALGLPMSGKPVPLTANSSQNIDNLANDISDWVTQGGQGARAIRNSDGDFILVDGSNTRRFRFDFYDTKPHTNPHMHLEWYENNKWVKPGPIYPSDVDPQ